MKVVIMAGGKGTRISSIASDIPKPMICIGGKPVLEHQINNLKAYGLTDITLVIGHLGHVIKDYFGNGRKFGVNISYFAESYPLGTAGALFKMPELTNDFLLMCGDIMMDVNFRRFIQFHDEHQAWASLMAHPNDHPYDSSLLVTELLPPSEKGGLPIETHRVIEWLKKDDERHYYQNRVNAGIEIISSRLLELVKSNFIPHHPEQPDKIDLDRDVLKASLGTGRIFAYDTSEYIKDMGTPDRYYDVETDFQNGKLSARNLQRPQKAIFLDRDGTINMHSGFVRHANDLQLIPGAAEAIRLINRSGYMAIVVSNQPVIARGECSFQDLKTIHDKMETELGQKGAYVDAIYYCPHHTDKGFEGELSDYKKDCNCRKPKPGMILQAAKDWNIDLQQSYMIGDSDKDVAAGQNAGVKQSLLIASNSPDSLLHAVHKILSKE